MNSQQQETVSTTFLREEVPIMNPNEYPICLTVKEVANILRVGKNKAYDITRREGFPTIKYGSRIIIPRDEFFTWLHEQATHHQVG